MIRMLSADDKLAEIKRLYYRTSRATIKEDFAKAIDLLKSMSSEEERERVAVYMDGLSQMRSEWAQAARGGVSPSGSRTRASAPRDGAPRERSGPSKSSSRRSR